MNEPILDHEKRDVYRVAIGYVAEMYPIAKSFRGDQRHLRDQWLRAAQSVPLNIAEGNGKQSVKDKNRFFEIARGSALECAAIHDILQALSAIDAESNRRGKSELKRIVSMLTRLIQRTDRVAERPSSTSTAMLSTSTRHRPGPNQRLQWGRVMGRVAMEDHLTRPTEPERSSW